MDKMIVYEDEALIVAYKPAGIATQTAKAGQADLVSELKNYRKRKGEEPYIGVIHRLDQPVEGLLAFAKTPHAAGKLSQGLRDGSLTKGYAALVAGIPSAKEGELADYLLKDGQANLSRVVPKGTAGSKEARLYWKLAEVFGAGSLAACSMLEIELSTGRHHQIRVQMAHAGHPLLGDVKYGSAASKALSVRYAVNHTALAADKLALRHPVTGKHMDFRQTDNCLKILKERMYINS